MLYCYTCGYSNEDTAHYCYSCGRQMLVAGSASQSPPTAESPPLPPGTSGKSRKVIVGSVLGCLATVVVIVVLVTTLGGESTPDDSADSSSSGNSINVTTLSVSERQTKEAKEATDLGIGVDLERFVIDFGDEMGFEFEDAPLEDGRSRKIGKSPTGIATLELIGPESNLTQVTLTLPLESSDGDLLVLYTMTAFSNVTPGHFVEGLEWFQDTMESAELTQSLRPAANDSFSGELGDTQVMLTMVPNSPVVLLSFISPETHITEMVLPTTPPTSSVWNPSKWETDQYETKKILENSEVLRVGASGNGGLEPGRYEYRDTNGGRKVVNESGCYLMLNKGEFNQHEVNLFRGTNFSVKLGPIHGYASFGGSGCRGSLYWMES